MSMRLFCDRMLGTLTRWLRFMGYDVSYPANDVDDDEIVESVQRDGRILITRDRVLAGKVRGSILLTTTDLDEQICQVVSRVGSPGGCALGRCGVCNTMLEPIEKSKVQGHVPEGVFQRQEEYMRCPRCERIYWQGSHYYRILEKIERLKKS